MAGGCSGCSRERSPPRRSSGPSWLAPLARWERGGSESDPATVPAGVCAAGHTALGDPLYVGRATYAGHLLPAAVTPVNGGAFMPWDGYVYYRLPHEYEVLQVVRGKMHWVAASDGDVPAHAFPAGLTADGERLFVARAHYRGALTPGRVSVEDRTCYIPSLAEEIAVTEYEVLIVA